MYTVAKIDVSSPSNHEYSLKYATWIGHTSQLDRINKPYRQGETTDET